MGIGELAAFGTALCWTVTVMSFEAAGRRVGSVPVNFLRLLIGLTFLTAFSLISRGRALPLDAGRHAWIWLSLSGVVGFVLGDLCLFRAFILIGSRITMVIFTLVPPITAVTSWAVLGETLSARTWLGMAVTIAGISLVVLTKPRGEPMRLAHSLGGILLALVGSAGQAVGLVLSKYGMGDMNAFSATQIRIAAAAVSFLLVLPAIGFAGRVRRALSNRTAMGQMTLGAFFGPFLGVSLSLVAVHNVEAGVAATIMAMVPVFLIPPEVLIMGKRVRGLEVLGAFVAVGGVALVSL